MSDLTFEQLLEKFPISEPEKITNGQFQEIVGFCKATLGTYKKEDKTQTYQQKIDSYKAYCKKEIYNKHPNLELEYSYALENDINYIVTRLIIQHLAD